MSKTTKTPTDSTPPTELAPAPTRAPRLRDTESPPEFETELEARRWHRKIDNRQAHLDQAYDKHPPGTMLYVSAARGIPSRTRAGVAFSGERTQTVEVSGQSDAEIAARVKTGEAVVSPLGACAIADDDGLIVHKGPKLSRADQAEAAARAAEDRAELERLRAENARLRARTAPESNDGRPSRLAPPSDKGDGKGAPAASETFGGDDKTDSKAGGRG